MVRQKKSKNLAKPWLRGACDRLPRRLRRMGQLQTRRRSRGWALWMLHICNSFSNVAETALNVSHVLSGQGRKRPVWVVAKARQPLAGAGLPSFGSRRGRQCRRRERHA